MPFLHSTRQEPDGSDTVKFLTDPLVSKFGNLGIAEDDFKEHDSQKRWSSVQSFDLGSEDSNWYVQCYIDNLPEGTQTGDPSPPKKAPCCRKSPRPIAKTTLSIVHEEDDAPGRRKRQTYQRPRSTLLLPSSSTVLPPQTSVARRSTTLSILCSDRNKSSGLATKTSHRLPSPGLTCPTNNPGRRPASNNSDMQEDPSKSFRFKGTGESTNIGISYHVRESAKSPQEKVHAGPVAETDDISPNPNASTPTGGKKRVTWSKNLPRRSGYSDCSYHPSEFARPAARRSVETHQGRGGMRRFKRRRASCVENDPALGLAHLAMCNRKPSSLFLSEGIITISDFLAPNRR